MMTWDVYGFRSEGINRTTLVLLRTDVRAERGELELVAQSYFRQPMFEYPVQSYFRETMYPVQSYFRQRPLRPVSYQPMFEYSVIIFVCPATGTVVAFNR
jgi:hypothetical protein